MAHITLSIPDDLYKKIKEHPEIKWSEIARESLASYLCEISGKSNTNEIKKRLSSKTLETLGSIPEKEAIRMHKEMAVKEWKRVKSATQTY